MEFDKTKYSTNISNMKDVAKRIKSIVVDIYEVVTPPEIKTQEKMFSG